MTARPPTSDVPPSRGSRWWTVVAAVAFVAAAVLLLRYQADKQPRLNGDGWEYWYMAESFHRHGTPELLPSDRAAVDREASRISDNLWIPPDHPYAYMNTPEGRWFGVHFWSYALSSVPAKAYLEWTGESGLGGLGLANAAWFILAIGVTLFGSSAPVGQRLALAVLAAAGPVLWYIAWTGAELFSWAMVLIAVVTYRDRRYAWSAAAAGLAATQNPPIILFGAVAVLAAMCERRWRVAALAIAGTAIGLIPYGFFQYHFGQPNLIAGDSYGARADYISWVRCWSQLTDFNQGLLPYAPFLVLGAVAGAIRMVYTRDFHGLLLLAGGVAVAVGTQVSRNWNSGCDGLQRYLVWIIPFAAGVAVQGIGGRWRLWALAAAALVAHVAILYEFERADALQGGYLEHTAVAKWVLTHCPEAYWVEPEVFVERVRHVDDWPRAPVDLPLGFARPDGTVSKMLLDAEAVEKLPKRYEVEPGYLATLQERAARASRLFYVHPPRARVRATEPTAGLSRPGSSKSIFLVPRSRYSPQPNNSSRSRRTAICPNPGTGAEEKQRWLSRLLGVVGSAAASPAPMPPRSSTVS